MNPPQDNLKKEIIEEDIEYLDQEFPKGKTKFRGQAMVLLALARKQAKSETLKKVFEEIENLIKEKRIREKIEETKEPKSEWAMLRAGDLYERNKLELLEELTQKLKELETKK
jgi:predicted RNA-binding protein